MFFNFVNEGEKKDQAIAYSQCFGRCLRESKKLNLHQQLELPLSFSALADLTELQRNQVNINVNLLLHICIDTYRSTGAFGLFIFLFIVNE